MAKTAAQKLREKKDPKKVVLEKDFAGVKAGQRMLVGTPQIIDAYLRKVPCGETRSIQRLRNELARRHGCDAMCPVSTAIFLRISAQAAVDELESGTPLKDVTPFWRAIAPDDKVAAKLSIDREWIRSQRESERPPHD